MRDTYELGISLGLMPSDFERLSPQERWNVLTYCRENGTPLQRIEFYLEYLLYYFVNSHAKVSKEKVTFPKKGDRETIESAIEKAVSGGKHQSNRRKGRRRHGFVYPGNRDKDEVCRIAIDSLVQIQIRPERDTPRAESGDGR